MSPASDTSCSISRSGIAALGGFAFGICSTPSMGRGVSDAAAD
jgi:hypothetical protein